jgi:hypothetical protein
MKHLLTALLLCIPTTVIAQPSLWWDVNNVSTDVNGGPIAKDDTIAIEIKLNQAATTIRSVFFDFQHQKDALTLIDVQRGVGIPAAASFSYTNNYYPNCRFNRTAQNTTNIGWDNYINAQYTCNSTTVPYHAINRIMVNVASAQNLEHATYVRLRFRVTNVAAGFPYDSIYMNFAVGYDAAGATMTNTQNVGVKGVWVQLAPGANNLLSGTVSHGTNVSNGLRGMMKLSVTDTAAQPTEAANTALGTGSFGFGQQLQPSSWYRMRLMVPADSIAALSRSSVTVSDYTAAVQEWITQNLDKTFKNQNIDRGIKYWAADANNNGQFDGGDLQRIFNAVAGLDTLVKAPAGCAANCMVTVPTIRGTTYDTLGLTAWKTFANPFFTQLQTSTVEQTVPLKYVLRGDVNLSHSSAVAAQAATFKMGNFVVPGASSIDVTLNNVVVTGNTINIPFNVDTKTLKLSGLQFEVKYDPAKVKFEKLEVNTPSWISFVNDDKGVIRFGALDRDFKNFMSGTALVPFKLEFTSVQAGVNLNSSVQIHPTMDAADDKGKQVGINFNSTNIKLIGANFFKNP